MADKKFYITTPIYYPSGKWHLGTCYTTVVCDAIARFKRLQGIDVFYLTGTDEHGQKIQDVAKQAGVGTVEYIEEIVGNLKKLWKLLDISYDKFIRTTDKEHKEAVQKIFQKLYDKGDIYKSQYEGMYCSPCEAFWTKSQLKDGKCPDCGREVKNTKEESYFFKLSKYQDKIQKLLENGEFLQPKSRVNEMINNFIKPGLQDLAVTRTSFDWGIKVPFDDKHIIYVWIDALANYITALGYTSDDESLFDKYWPADVHIMGKEIIRFHSIIWPAILMALDIPVPKKVYGHGWLLMGEDKMSKSKGNVVDPFILADKYSVDAVRYFLLREIPFGSDGMYNNRILLTRINSDLANDLGNLASRTTAMACQYFDGITPSQGKLQDVDKDLIKTAQNLYKKVQKHIDNLDVPKALDEIFALVQSANKYIDLTKPWVLIKEDKKRLQTVIYNLLETLRIIAVMLQPFLIDTTKKIFKSLGVDDKAKTFESIKTFGYLKEGVKVIKQEPLFPRINIEKELQILQKEAEKIQKEQKVNTVTLSEISIEEFKKINLITAKVLEVEKIPKADKLLKLTLDDGNKKRTVVSGIAEYYKVDELLGKQVVIVDNLKPVKLRGVLSEGMILCASDDSGNLSIISPEKDFAPGTKVE